MLDDLNILIVEDEALVALDLSMTLEDVGAEIVGPCMTVATALQSYEAADAAILDVDLRGEAVFPVADALKRSGTPFVFHTGRSDISVLRERYGEDVPIFVKPGDAGRLASKLAEMVQED